MQNMFCLNKLLVDLMCVTEYFTTFYTEKPQLKDVGVNSEVSNFDEVQRQTRKVYGKTLVIEKA